MNKAVFIRQEDLAKELGISKTTLWRWRRDKRLPPPIHLSSRVVGWRTADIEQWLITQSEPLD